MALTTSSRFREIYIRAEDGKGGEQGDVSWEDTNGVKGSWSWRFNLRAEETTGDIAVLRQIFASAAGFLQADGTALTNIRIAGYPKEVTSLADIRDLGYYFPLEADSRANVFNERKLGADRGSLTTRSTDSATGRVQHRDEVRRAPRPSTPTGSTVPHSTMDWRVHPLSATRFLFVSESSTLTAAAIATALRSQALISLLEGIRTAGPAVTQGDLGNFDSGDTDGDRRWTFTQEGEDDLVLSYVNNSVGVSGNLVTALVTMDVVSGTFDQDRVEALNAWLADATPTVPAAANSDHEPDGSFDLSYRQKESHYPGGNRVLFEDEIPYAASRHRRLPMVGVHGILKRWAGFGAVSGSTDKDLQLEDDVIAVQLDAAGDGIVQGRLPKPIDVAEPGAYAEVLFHHSRNAPTRLLKPDGSAEFIRANGPAKFRVGFLNNGDGTGETILASELPRWHTLSGGDIGAFDSNYIDWHTYFWFRPAHTPVYCDRLLATPWTQGTAYALGAFVYVQFTGYRLWYRCVRAHTAAAGNVADGGPNQSNQTGWRRDEGEYYADSDTFGFGFGDFPTGGPARNTITVEQWRAHQDGFSVDHDGFLFFKQVMNLRIDGTGQLANNCRAVIVRVRGNDVSLLPEENTYQAISGQDTPLTLSWDFTEYVQADDFFLPGFMIEKSSTLSTNDLRIQQFSRVAVALPNIEEAFSG